MLAFGIICKKVNDTYVSINIPSGYYTLLAIRYIGHAGTVYHL